MHMGGVQNSRSQGLYAVRRVGIEQLMNYIFVMKRAPIGNHALQVGQLSSDQNPG